MSQEDHFQSIIEASENDFEKKLFVINTGALTLSVGFIDSIVPLDTAVAKAILIAGWVVLVLNLLLNLTSHLESTRRVFNRQYSLYYEDKSPKEIAQLTRKDAVWMRVLNWTTVILLTSGIGLIVTFVAINM
jgi:hypothetical protein